MNLSLSSISSNQNETKDCDISQEKEFPLPPEMQITSPTCLDRRTFKMENIKIVGQFNKQVILVVVPSQVGSILHCFDQHGVHERIRLEEILKGAVEHPRRNIRSRQLYPPFEFPWDVSSIAEDIEEYKEQLFDICALKLETKTVQITGHPKETIMIVRNIPASFNGYYHVTYMKRCIIDAIRYVKNLNEIQANGEQRRGMFPYLLNHIRSRACHGAIRFGEILSKQSSKHLIHQLSQCQQQFRCAHGRVLVKPICRIPPNDPDDNLRKKNEMFEEEFGQIEYTMVRKY